MENISQAIRTLKAAIDDPELSSEVVEAVEKMRAENENLEQEVKDRDEQIDAIQKDYAEFRKEYDDYCGKLNQRERDLDGREKACRHSEAKCHQAQIQNAADKARADSFSDCFNLVFRNSAIKRRVIEDTPSYGTDENISVPSGMVNSEGVPIRRVSETVESEE